MCGRYTLTSPEDIAARFGLGALAETRIEPRFNVSTAINRPGGDRPEMVEPVSP